MKRWEIIMVLGIILGPSALVLGFIAWYAHMR